MSRYKRSINGQEFFLLKQITVTYSRIKKELIFISVTREKDKVVKRPFRLTIFILLDSLKVEYLLSNLYEFFFFMKFLIVLRT